MSRSEFTKFNVEENIRTMEKSLICRGLTISQEGGPIWKKMSHTYAIKVPKVTVYIWSNCGERCVIKRIDILRQPQRWWTDQVFFRKRLETW